MSPYYLVAVIAFVGVLWLLVALPQKRIRRQHDELVAELKEGDLIMTAGGFHGTVRGVEEDTVRLEIAPSVEVTLARGAVAALLAPAQEPGAGSESNADDNSKQVPSS